MKKKRKTKKVAFSIRSKLLLLLSVSMLPFLLIAVYLLISIANYNQTYHEIVDRLTIANTYNIQFNRWMKVFTKSLWDMFRWTILQMMRRLKTRMCLSGT